MPHAWHPAEPGHGAWPWDASVEDGTNPLELMVLIMDQYGNVKSCEDGKYARYPCSIAVGRTWVREWFGSFQGDALLLVVALDGTIVAAYEEPRLLRDVAPDTRQSMILKFADP